MTPRSLQAVLRTLADAGTPVSDAELLRNFLANDEAAFAELVKRHGRLVWAVCRTQTGSDAEADDAFQATFLVLLQSAKKVRDGGKLSSWLHGVAYKVCAKARQAAKRRTTREQATAHREGNGTAVPESAWDRALAAVHEEVAKLPDTLRVPFVLCCFEGKGVTEAAEQLGWKLGTLSGRLTRAKDAVLAKLDARGLTLGVVAAVGLAVPPAAAVAKATALAHVGFTVPGSILQLSQGVIGMSMKSVKMLAATVLLACGLGASVGTGWVATADAQQPSQTKSKADAEAEVKRLQAELEKARAAAELAAKQAHDAQADALRSRDRALEQFRLAERLFKDTADKAKAGGKPESKPVAFKTAKWEYDLVDIAKTFNADTFGTFLQERENAGWEFLGSTTLGSSGGVFQWLFRRPVKSTSSIYYTVPDGKHIADYSKYVPATPGAIAEFTKPAVVAPGGTPSTKPITVVEAIKTAGSKLDDAKSIEAEIAKLTARLKELQLKPGRVVFMKDALPLDPAEFAGLLTKLAEKKFGKGKCSVSSSEHGVAVEGDKDVTDWASAVVKSLTGK